MPQNRRMEIESGADSLAFVPDDTQRVAGTTVAAGLIGWWPAFTLGTYGVVFFEQILALWVAATSVLLVVLLSRPRALAERPAWIALAVPSLWIALALALPAGGTSEAYTVLFWFGVVVTLLGFPGMAALLVRILVPGARRLRGRNALIAVGVVALMMVCSYVLGTLHPRLLTCEDFTISGNFAPAGCTSGVGTTVG